MNYIAHFANGVIDWRIMVYHQRRAEHAKEEVLVVVGPAEFF